jgi:predicted Mrr-cat superfamily restriction endonuclease
MRLSLWSQWWIVKTNCTYRKYPIRTWSALNQFVDHLPGLHLIKEYEKLKEHYKKTHPEDNKYQVGQIIRQIWNFMYEVKVGDLVLLPLGQKSNALAVGKIVGEYQYKHLHSEIEQYRPVHWLKKDVNKDEFEPEIQESFDDRGTVHYIGDLDVVNKLKDMLKKLGVN